MISNHFGIIRQYNESPDLIAIPFGFSMDMIEKFEELQPEWIEGAYYNNVTQAAVASPEADANMRYAIMDMSATDYEYMLVGISVASTATGNTVSGVRAAADSGALTQWSLCHTNPVTYGLLSLENTPYAYLSQSIAVPLPVFGIKFKS